MIKDKKKCVIKRKLEFKDYKNGLELAEIENETINQYQKQKKDLQVKSITFLLKKLI